MTVCGNLVITALLALSLAAGSPPEQPWRIAWPTVRKCIDLRESIMLKRGNALRYSRCDVIGGLFVDEWAKDTFVGAGSEVGLDHVMAAKTMWFKFIESNDRPPTRQEWLEIYTWRKNLWLTRGRTNSQKKDRGPHEWCPEDASPVVLREAAKVLRATAKKFGFSFDADEELGVQSWERGGCYAR